MHVDAQESHKILVNTSSSQKKKKSKTIKELEALDIICYSFLLLQAVLATTFGALDSWQVW